MSMKYAKRLAAALLAAVLSVFPLSGCQQGGTSSVSDAGEIGYQLDPPEAGEEIAVLTTNMGEIKIRFFPEAAPKAVENFKTHIQEGYYDGLIFHRVIDGFMIQGGDPEGTGRGGKSIWGEPFEDEFSKNLFNIRGALAMANSGPNKNGSQFFINQGDASSFAGWDTYEQNSASYKEVYDQLDDADKETFVNMYGSMPDMDLITDEIKQLYEENGGNPNLDGAYSIPGRGHTVFGQVFEGMDVVDAIATVETDENDKPLQDVIIEKAELQTYEG